MTDKEKKVCKHIQETHRSQAKYGREHLAEVQVRLNQAIDKFILAGGWHDANIVLADINELTAKIDRIGAYVVMHYFGDQTLTEFQHPESYTQIK